MHMRMPSTFRLINPLLLTVFLMTWASGSYAQTEPLSKQSVPLLERIARENSANHARVRTWRGKVEFSLEVGTIGNDPLQEVEKAKIRFVYDREKQWSLSVYEQTKAAENEGGLTLEATMLKDDGYYRYGSHPPDHFPVKFLAILRIDAASEGRKTEEWTTRGDFRPLGMSTPGANVSGLMLSYVKAIGEGTELKDTTLSREGNLITLRNELGGVLNEYVVDLDRAASLVQFLVKGSDPSLVWKCEVQNVAGVYVPKVLTRDNVRGKQRSIERMRWFDQVVNEPIPPDEFTIANLGVHRGDRVQDSRTGATYELSDENLPPRLTPGIAQQLRLTPSIRWKLLLIPLLSVLLLVPGYLVFRRYQKARASG